MILCRDYRRIIHHLMFKCSRLSKKKLSLVNVVQIMKIYKDVSANLANIFYVKNAFSLNLMWVECFLIN